MARAGAEGRDPTAEFEDARPALRALAYRMLGSVEDAEDVVQETWVRWAGAPHGEIRSPRAWLTAACTRLAIDVLRSARRRRESYVGPWLPEPVVEPLPPSPRPPDAEVELAESLSLAFLLLLERLTPTERAAYLLHDVLDYEYAAVGEVLGRSEVACRQLVSRARRRLGRDEARFEAPDAARVALLERFVAAARSGEVEALEAILASDAELWSDGGGAVPAATNVVAGAGRVARLLAGLARKAPAGASAHAARVNGAPGLVLVVGGRVDSVYTFRWDAGGRLDRVLVVRNPAKLRRVPLPDPRTALGPAPAHGVQEPGGGEGRATDAEPQRRGDP